MIPKVTPETKETQSESEADEPCKEPDRPNRIAGMICGSRPRSRIMDRKSIARLQKGSRLPTGTAAPKPVALRGSKKDKQARDLSGATGVNEDTRLVLV